MGPLGTQELVFIFILALLLFGPKKLPELGKTIGKAMTEFRRAQTELKTTFDREMKNLERETGINELAATTFQTNSYNYEPSTYDPDYYGGSYDGSYNSTATTTTIEGASAILGAGSATTLQIEAAAGSIPSGHFEQANGAHAEQHALPAASPVPNQAPAALVEHSPTAPAETAPHNG
jgi:sec-independent protein translocase protein TatA